MDSYRKIRRPSTARAVRPEDWRVVFEKNTTPTQATTDFLKEHCGYWIKADAMLVRLLSVETEGRKHPWIVLRSPGIAYYSEPIGLALSIALPVKRRK